MRKSRVAALVRRAKRAYFNAMLDEAATRQKRDMVIIPPRTHSRVRPQEELHHERHSEETL